MKWRITYKEINKLAAEKVLEQQEYYSFAEVLETLQKSLDTSWVIMERKNIEYVFRNDVLKVVVAYRDYNGKHDMITLEKVLPQTNQHQAPLNAPRLM